MNILTKFSPEQLAALSPEQIAVIFIAQKDDGLVELRERLRVSKVAQEIQYDHGKHRDVDNVNDVVAYAFDDPTNAFKDMKLEEVDRHNRVKKDMVRCMR